MIRFKSKRLMTRLISNFFIIAMMSILMISCITFYYSRNALQQAAFNQLAAVCTIKEKQIHDFIRNREGIVKILSESNDTKLAYDLLIKYHNAGGGDPNGPYDVHTAQYEEIYQKIGNYFRNFLDTFGFKDIYFICAPHGHVMYTTARERDLGTNLGVGPYRQSGLSSLWSSVVNQKKIRFEDFTQYSAIGKPAAFVGSPLFNEKGQVVAVIALQIDSKRIDAIMQEKTGMGQSGETYLVGSDMFMRSSSRFESNSTILEKQVDTVATKNAINGKSGHGIIVDYRGIKVLSSYSSMHLGQQFDCDFEWAIVAEIDEKEAFAPIYSLLQNIILSALFILIVSFIIGYIASKTIVVPVKYLSDNVNKIAAGDLTVTFEAHDREDEIGVMMKGFKEMLENLRTQTSEMLEGASTLASSISQITATVSQMATSSTETSSSIAEITATVEEVRQTVQVSSQKANQVVDVARKAADVSESGKKATNDTIQGIKRIKDEMEYIADSIVKLSEQTQSIGDIINAVNDLADQSNLLSVNASIEAAKAGEHGKGFAVVAQEVKSLAEQSKNATNDVTSILSDIQKATSAAVMATERGGKTVEDGVNLSAQAGEAISILSQNVTESSQSALQIASSTQEQLVGMDQLAEAMENIKQASTQNADGAKQLEDSVNNLDALAKKMKMISNKFRV
ncbi:MAG: Methyl-accepting chemotaxis sensory transducer [Candidatus Magnetoglobus multicellularis str. Araruama]|uniref:Methyl-accepting chemotaxis sensory transducer n=1 Tax=Candidatus Magnetoglobus multicellularis str. Araruama TaxID=890399 RepID=A0A1V1PEC2_9BACT|nr:MAG: Methyl-accepting chemotaxis sensory transducer [Candidatus Magnetoglobus multicellularis str. Araruama]